MILTVSQHAMWGLKVKTESSEKLNNGSYIIEYKNTGLFTKKNLNKCNEFINADIQNWIITNKYNIYKERHPTQFSAILSGNTITITGKKQ